MASPAIVLIGNESSVRTELFQTALRNRGLPKAHLVRYIDLLEGNVQLEKLLSPDTVIRIESPGKDFAVEKALLARGESQAKQEGVDFIPAQELLHLDFDKGRILAPRQWYHGYSSLLQELKATLSNKGCHGIMNHPDDILTMFDKGRCHQIMQSRNIPTPRGVGTIHSFEELQEIMRRRRLAQVFVKLNHGSSASGVVAYRTNGKEHKAFSTVEMVHSGGKLRLYNSRKIRTYNCMQEIAPLVDELCKNDVHVEEWFPKAKLDGKIFDLRVLVVGGRAMHVVMRKSDSPFTNLHLLNSRGDCDGLRNKLGEARWNELLRCCEETVKIFDRSLYAGVDIMVETNFRSHAVAEINAFGDHLNGVYWQGKDTYTAELDLLALTAERPIKDWALNRPATMATKIGSRFTGGMRQHLDIID